VGGTDAVGPDAGQDVVHHAEHPADRDHVARDLPGQIGSWPAPPAVVPGQAQPAPVFRVEVIAATPLPGVDLTLDQIPAPIQTALDADILGSGAIDITDFLNRRVTGVYVNELRGNPFQPDVSYRGYTASPLLGTPQGLSVYMDGVRMNQPFGDVVSWDLVPRLAISSIAVMPGSNPLFGLNTLGGALAMQTKTGRTSPGTTVQALYGSDVRRAIEFEHGGSNASGLNWYVAGNLFAEHGWRDDSPSVIRTGDRDGGTLDRLEGRGELQVRILSQDRLLEGSEF